MIFVAPAEVDPTRGKTLGDGGPSVLIRLGPAVTSRTILDDWVLAHELVHVGFPDVEPRHAWFEEGLATYVEPLARARAGLITPARVWRDFAENLPGGAPTPGGQGLDSETDNTRVYWGGALYFLLADLAIRERTAGRLRLDDALAAIVASGANAETTSTIDRVLDAADRATGTTVMREFYTQLGRQPGRVDVAALLARLGVHLDGGRLTFDDRAPLAAVRGALTARSR
jgi:hypothetical protein